MINFLRFSPFEIRGNSVEVLCDLVSTRVKARTDRYRQDDDDEEEEGEKNRLNSLSLCRSFRSVIRL